MGFPNRKGTVAVAAWSSMRTIGAYREIIHMHRGAFNVDVPIGVARSLERTDQLER